MQSPEIRARQHLIVQGFTTYTCTAAVCTRLVDPQVLDDPEHAWAVLFDSRSLRWTSMLPEGDPLRNSFAEAAVRSAAPGNPHALCRAAGSTLLVPLVVTDVLNARMRIEAAVALGKVPPAERLSAYPDELIEREAARRAKLKAQLGDVPPAALTDPQ
jgi:hypothetical protein